MRLKEEVAIVTGGGGGLGEGICLCLAREGTHVVVSDVKLDLAEKVAAKVRETGRKALALQTDVRIEKECQYLIEKSLKEMGRIDILVCGSGVNGFAYWGDSEKPLILENVSEEDWDLTIDVNLKGVFLCNKAIAPYFKQQKKGKIINVSSVAGRKAVDFMPHYSASKAGVIVFTQAVASQLAPYNINVNTICPGFIWTPLWEPWGRLLSKNIPALKGMSPKEVFNALVPNRALLRRPQTPEDIGNAVVFLASEEAKEITGQAINIDGGSFFS
jgi:NAD(P)-dependent dehydrogenase (short-subunit alcohol dehydrogenase family)